jgi:protein-S-isoprenylcysteine O-methyltransferase Ste14
MTFKPDGPAMFAFVVVVLCWLGFGVILIVGKKAAAATEAKRDLKSHIGFALQCCGYVICFTFHRRYFSPLIPNSRIGDVLLSATIIAIAVTSEWFCFEAARTLGKQWALVARLIHDHELVQQGPYAVVRNPIYLAMFGNLLAIGLVLSRWEALIAAVVVFAAGTGIRIHSEEKLLREAFGPKFEDYARSVPAFFPRIPP